MNVEVELKTLEDELADAYRRYERTDAAGQKEIRRQIREIIRDISRYSTHERV